ncbi:proteasome component M29 [Coemansia sp. RSA 552]|nr:proteasome component M29 [Coemansia sp. RSA 552]
MTDSADIELIENLRLRFALANSDEQLQKLVTGLLVPLLDKLDIASASVRTKIIVLLGQINKKLKGHPEVGLPVSSLLETTFSKDPTGFAQSFRLMYVTMAVESAEEEQLISAIPMLLGGIQSRPRSQLATLNTSLLTAIWRCSELSEDNLRGSKSIKDTQQGNILIALAHDLFLFNAAAPGPDGGPVPVACGLSAERQAMVTNNGKAPWASDSSALQTLKLRLIHIVGSGLAFPSEMPAIIHERRLLALLCASCDPYFQDVAQRGKDAVKRMTPIDFESPSFVGSAFAMFLGGVLPGDAGEPRSPVNTAAKLKLLGFLSKSVVATASYEQWSRVVSEGLFGAGSSAKLRQHCMSFLLWSIGKAPIEKITQAAPLVLGLVQRTLSEGPGNASLSSDILRGSAYVALGTLARRVPGLALDSLEHLQTMFGAFESESTTVRLSIQEGLLAMLPAYEAGDLAVETKRPLLALLQAQLTSSTYQARYCALRYAVGAFPFADMDARWLCILGTSDPKPEIQQLAMSGLKITPSTILERSDSLPSLEDAVRFVHLRASKVISGSVLLSSPPKLQFDISNPHVYGAALDFCRSLLLARGIVHIRESEGGLAIDQSDLEFVNAGRVLSSELQRSSMQKALADLDALGHSLVASWLDVIGAVFQPTKPSETTILARALMYLVELLSMGSVQTALAFFNRRDLVLRRLNTHDMDIQLRAAQAGAVIFSAKLLTEAQSEGAVDCTLWNEQVAAQLDGFLADAQASARPKQLDTQQGAILATGYIAHGLEVARLAAGKSWSELGLDHLGKTIRQVQRTLISGISRAGETSTRPETAAAWCFAAGEVCQLGFGDSELGEATDALEAAAQVVKGASSPRVYEAGLSLLSNIALGSPSTASELITFLGTTTKSVTKKQLDIHFKTGEALARCLGRFKCSLVKMDWIFPIEPSAVFGSDGIGANEDGVGLLLEAVTANMAKSANVQERQAAAIWTLTLVQSCPDLDALVPWLSKLHSCMCMLLSDRSELTQEVASRALGLIYNMGDATLKEDMVYSLMSLFGGGNRGTKRPGVDGNTSSVQQALHRQIQSDEPLLEQESLGQTPDGHAMNTTYKSILSLASDMQNPSLVYQFMQLATHTAMWNSRCGAAYGVANIIEQARGAIQPYMESMIPKLYRYTFDPSPQTQMAMKSIWNALLGPGSSRGASSASGEDVPVTGANVVERYWDDILEECLTSMGQREWKARESGCNALAGAVLGADPELVVPFLDRIWHMSFRALDDIKGSVRTSALRMCQSLATATVTWCTPQGSLSPSHDKQAQAVVAVVIPFLVDKGVASDAEDVRNFSMGLLLKLCRAGEHYLSPFAPGIIERLIESLSNMESQSANYLTFHADGHGISPEQLESARLAAVKASPIMQGIETVLEYLTPSSMEELVPKLQSIIRHGLGLPARAGCARTVVVLCVKKPDLVRPFASALVKAISGSLTESSVLQRQTWAAAIGYMAPMLSQGMFKNLLKHLEKLYFEKYDSDMRGVSGQVLEQLAQRCPERLCENPDGPGTTSFAIFGSQDASEAVGKAFQSAWQEYNLGLGSALVEDGLSELLRLPLAHIAADSWPCRIQSAKAIVEATRMVERRARATANEGSDPISGRTKELARATLPALVEAVRGRTWPGKEHVLGALVNVCTACARYIDTDEELQSIPVTVCEVLRKEMRQGEIAYRREIIRHYCTLLEKTDLDVYGLMSDTLLGIVGHLGEASKRAAASGAMDVDDSDNDDEQPMKRPQQLMLVATAIKALQLTLKNTRNMEQDAAQRLCDVLQDAALRGVWNVRVASLECLVALLEHGANKGGVADAFFVDAMSILAAVRECASDGKYVPVRAAALATLAAIYAAIGAASESSVATRSPGWRAEADAILELFLHDTAPSVSDRAKELRQHKK